MKQAEFACLCSVKLYWKCESHSFFSKRCESSLDFRLASRTKLTKLQLVGQNKQTRTNNRHHTTTRTRSTVILVIRTSDIIKLWRLEPSSRKDPHILLYADGTFKGVLTTIQHPHRYRQSHVFKIQKYY